MCIACRVFKELGNDRCMESLIPDPLTPKDRAVLRKMKLHA